MEERDHGHFVGEERMRYARHFALPEVGPQGQRRLKESRVLVVGAGGLGSPAALYLVAAGVGELGIVDPDRVELSNLQRQVLHGTSRVGALKVDSAGERLRDLNPHVRITPYPVRLDPSNALEILRPYHLIVDGSDNLPTRYLINDACLVLEKPWIYGAVEGWEGQVAVFGVPGGPCYRCLFREPPPPGLVPTCAQVGVLGAVPGVVGSLQAVEALKLLLGVGESLAGRLLVWDAFGLSFRDLRIRKDPACPACGKAAPGEDPPGVDSSRGGPALAEGSGAMQGGLGFGGFLELPCGAPPGAAQEAVPEVSPQQVRAWLESPSPPLLVDVREPWEWAVGNLGRWGAVLIPYGELEEKRESLPRDRPLVVYCHVGVRSALAVGRLKEWGFSEVVNLRGGYLAWAAEMEPWLPRY